MHYIQNHSTLLQLCNQLKNQQWLALDTEFMRERTYYAQLCLVQIATESSLVCVDPLALDTIDPLLDILYDEKCLKIVHAGRQDFELFFDLRQTLPKPVFDAQIAAAFLGYAQQIGYADLVQQRLGKQLDKSLTRTNWSKRPLSDAQIRYALDDVRYLPELHNILSRELENKNRMQWVAEDTQRLTDPTTYNNDPTTAAERIKHTGKLDANGHRLLALLADWRERVAQEKNIPRNWVISNKALVEICLEKPKKQQDLGDIQTLSEKNIARWGNTILRILDSKTPAVTNNAIENIVLSKKQSDQCKKIQKFIEQYATEQDIHPSVVATKKEIKSLVLNRPGNVFQNGWRKRELAETLQSLLN